MSPSTWPPRRACQSDLAPLRTTAERWNRRRGGGTGLMEVGPRAGRFRRKQCGTGADPRRNSRRGYARAQVVALNHFTAHLTLLFIRISGHTDSKGHFAPRLTLSFGRNRYDEQIRRDKRSPHRTRHGSVVPKTSYSHGPAAPRNIDVQIRAAHEFSIDQIPMSSSPLRTEPNTNLTNTKHEADSQ